MPRSDEQHSQEKFFTNQKMPEPPRFREPEPPRFREPEPQPQPKPNKEDGWVGKDDFK